MTGIAGEGLAYRYDPAVGPDDLIAKRLVGRFYVVGYEGLPERDWRRVLFYQNPDGLFRPADPAEVTFPRPSGRPPPTHLLLVDPVTGRRLEVAVLATRPPRPEGAR